MSRHLFKFVNNLKLRWKMTVVVLPLVLIPIFVVGTVVGWIAYRQAHLGITQTSMDDLDHLAAFTIDLLDAHNQQFQAYRDLVLGYAQRLLSHRMLHAERTLTNIQLHGDGPQVWLGPRR